MTTNEELFAEIQALKSQLTDKEKKIYELEKLNQWYIVITSYSIHYTKLYETRDEYIFYRNDHHWTTLGAYYAYASTIKKMGFSPVLLNKYEIEHASSGFKGTLYSKSLYDRIKPDVLDFYNYSNGAKVTSVLINNGIDETENSAIFFRDFLNKKDKYSAFLGTNQPVISIKTNADNNNKLLVIKDSYAIV